MIGDEGLDGEVGPLDIGAMEQILQTFLESDGLVDESATGFDSYLDPAVASIRFEDGIGAAKWCRFDVTWYRTGCYSFHYVDARDANYRYDCHPKENARIAISTRRQTRPPRTRRRPASRSANPSSSHGRSTSSGGGPSRTSPWKTSTRRPIRREAPSVMGFESYP